MDARKDFPDGHPRCGWVDQSVIYCDYHDQEWGRPSADDRHLFEQICLEGMQSGLSWRTILNKRDGYRQAFAGFDIDAIARFGREDVERLVQDAGIVRHRGKIEAIINNARRAREMREREGSLAAFFWRFEGPDRPLTDGAPTAEAIALSKALKNLGWSFVGPTTVYAFMQSIGMVNDHHAECFAQQACAHARSHFKRPSA
ncbi:DNA-3-methyladenine glycosylase I [Bordetella holmesii]|uniref:Methyladenine glycosylase n=2 Tax=Bordetella holmesii TaxID=35814 RepID=A0A158M0E3_9BORD|nr:DNA-3-methyladenine glycosylase I [Bordetella holmesii]AHV93135.1 methyladenine glycosylase family protein [Bordetella holmesii ATCC 51541]AIT25311.1 methyladenine glycosylase family protein [Bordetella holmesii 44057]EWM45877.1 methyladenine glycosylase family protein [Bordetella holmesii 70147]EWM48483.1 methyladenine glycosylase family protein [Bordetella holmesii 41130]EWM50007.1 methyladenine glycosylase family protein [Bordetella holmesii 35009]